MEVLSSISVNYLSSSSYSPGMPRPRVKDEDRRRVRRACDNCKRRKEKCDGKQPCFLCTRRSREPECVFSDEPGKPVMTAKASATESSSQSVELREDMADTSDAEIAVESLLTLSGASSSQQQQHQQRQQQSAERGS